MPKRTRSSTGRSSGMKRLKVNGTAKTIKTAYGTCSKSVKKRTPVQGATAKTVSCSCSKSKSRSKKQSTK